MKAKSQKPKLREGAIEELNAAIAATNHAENVSSIAQAKAVFGSVNALLTLIEVCFLFLCRGLLQIHTYKGSNGERVGLRRAWVILRRYLPST